MPDRDTAARTGTDPAAVGLPRHVLRLSDPGQRGSQPFAILPTAEERASIARHLGIPGLRKLRFEGRLTPAGRRDWTLEAELGATVVQDCVVTLAPVVTRIDEPVLRRYMADLPEPGPGEVEMPQDDSIEDLPASLDLCGVMIEALSLALPPFPRAPGAELGEITVTEPGVAPLDVAAVRPFAGLADLRRTLAGPAGDGAQTEPDDGTDQGPR
jgi:uncharacterized metal-binding protein YceD (DUF177 family)